jgi:hypothetical protein
MGRPRTLYHRGWGGLPGHTFLLITHQGRRTGKRRETVAMALTYDEDTRETVVCSAILGWGDLGTEAAVREFVRSRPFVSFRPANRRAGRERVETFRTTIEGGIVIERPADERREPRLDPSSKHLESGDGRC